MTGAVGLDGVFVAGDFEAFFALFQANHGDVCEFDLVRGLVYLGGWHGCGCLWVCFSLGVLVVVCCMLV